MRIDDVSLTIFRWDGIAGSTYLPDSFAASSNLGLLRVRTDEGVEGHAFLGRAYNPATTDAAGLVRWLKPAVMGQDPLDREHIHGRLMAFNRLAGFRTIGAMDVALWDIAGKLAGMPVHRLMGTARHSIRAYASSPPILPSIEAYVEEALALKAAGWTAYKVHPTQQLETDIRLVTAVRAAVGDDYTLMLDASWAYRYEEALRLGRAAERSGYLWFEDPLREEDIYGCQKLRQKLDIPIMATEQPAGGVDSYASWILDRATDYLRGDVPNKGGLTAMLKTAHLAEAFGMQYEVHHSGNSHANLANLHAVMAIRNTGFFEVMLPAGTHQYGMIDDLAIDAHGLLHAPTAPGIGGQIDFDLIARTTEAVLT